MTTACPEDRRGKTPYEYEYELLIAWGVKSDIKIKIKTLSSPLPAPTQRSINRSNPGSHINSIINSINRRRPSCLPPLP